MFTQFSEIITFLNSNEIYAYVLLVQLDAHSSTLSYFAINIATILEFW
jgi:hypothetical protein